MNSIITTERIDAYCLSLLADERSAGTISKYRRDLTAFARWLDGRTVTKETAAGWKSHLSHRGYVPRTINSMLASLNSFCRFAGLPIKVKFLKIQRQIFRDSAKELTKAGRATITLKGKIRTILLPAKLCRKLMQYAKKQKIAAGEIFLTSSGKGISRRQVWYELKRLCKTARVEPTKVFPHNLRHLFATTFYRVCRDIVRLADVLGHSSIDTTHIYLMVSGAEQQRQLDRLGLVS